MYLSKEKETIEKEVKDRRILKVKKKFLGKFQYVQS